MEKKEVILGRNPIFEYLKNVPSGKNAQLYISNNAHGKIIDQLKGEAKKKGVSIFRKEKNFFSHYGSSSQHQGVILHIPKMHITETDDSIIHKVAEEKGLLVLLDQVTDPHNLGAIIRTTEALGGNGIIITKSHSASVTPTVIKASAGATAHIPIITISNVASFIDKAKKNDYWVVGTSDHGSDDIGRLSQLRPLLLIIGSEGSGLRSLTEKKCDSIIKIPLKGNVSSLNASVAAGIILYELLKD